jgi:hypothetical protein
MASLLSSRPGGGRDSIFNALKIRAAVGHADPLARPFNALKIERRALISRAASS